MKRCLELAALGKGHVAPNPMVGAVLVHKGRVIGEGWHRQYGEAHAEVNCLANVADADKHLIPDSTMYVSLEPCAHTGKTPPCASRLVAEKVKEVIICNIDPFEKVGGKGLEILQQNNIATTTQVLDAEGKWLNRRFYTFHQQQRPYIILKWAQSANGYFAPYGNKRYQLTNAYSQVLVHKWRTEEAAIMVGTNTALADDPQLTARLWQGKQPLRIVIDRSLILPGNLKLFDNEVPTWVVNDKKEEQVSNTSYIKLDFDGDMLQALIAKLYAANILSVIIEGGTKLLDSFIGHRLWDEARIFTAGKDIDRGLPAPLIIEGQKAFSTTLESDVLDVYVNKNSPYPYVQGMEL